MASVEHDACLLKQLSARILCDCLNQVVCHARQALLANHANQTLTLSMNLISNCSIASNAPHSSCPLDFDATHPHWGGITAHTSCRDISLYRTQPKGITILKHRWTQDQWYSTFEQSMSTLSLCSETEETDAQCSYCPLSMGPIVGDVLCLLHPKRVFLWAYHLASSGKFLE